MSVTTEATLIRGAALDDAHVGHIHGALGKILPYDTGPRNGWRARLLMLLAHTRPGAEKSRKRSQHAGSVA